MFLFENNLLPGFYNCHHYTLYIQQILPAHTLKWNISQTTMSYEIQIPWLSFVSLNENPRLVYIQAYRVNKYFLFRHVIVMQCGSTFCDWNWSINNEIFREVLDLNQNTWMVNCSVFRSHGYMRLFSISNPIM